MMRFSPRNQDLNLALRAADVIGHASPIWLVPVGDGRHVEIRTFSDVQSLSVRVSSVDMVKDSARGFAMEHAGMHLLGSLVSAGKPNEPVLFKADSKGWVATNGVGSVSGSYDDVPEPAWATLMPLSDGEGILIDPELLGGTELAAMLCEQIPALFGPSLDGKTLIIQTDAVTLWTLGIDKVTVKALKAMVQ